MLHEGSSNHPELSITQQAVHLHVSILDFAAYCKYKKRMKFEPNMQHVLGTVMTIVESWIAFLETVGEKDEVEQLKAFNIVIAKVRIGRAFRPQIPHNGKDRAHLYLKTPVLARVRPVTCHHIHERHFEEEPLCHFNGLHHVDTKGGLS